MNVECRCVGQVDVEPERAGEPFKLKYEFHYVGETGEVERIFTTLDIGSKFKPQVGMRYTIDTETQEIS